MPPELALDDILDLRAYERAREGYRRRVMALKERRRVALGPIMTLVFECFDTVRFQVHEMARAERIATDEGIRAELEVYNRLLPAPGELSATLFIELTTPDDLRRWLPALVGVERSLAFEIPGPGGTSVSTVRSRPERDHAEALTREEVTPAVHYLRFSFAPDEVERFAAGPVTLLADHAEYRARALLSESAHAELSSDLLGSTRPLPLA